MKQRLPALALISFLAAAGPALAEVNVKDHGVYGDGLSDNCTFGTSHDDTAAIQAILDDSILVPNQAHATVIYFPRGVYCITDTLQISRRIIIRGEGFAGSDGPSEIRMTNKDKDILDASTYLVNVFSMEGMILQGAGVYSGGTGNGIVLGRSSAPAYDSRISRNWFHNIPRAAIKGKFTDGYHIHDNGFELGEYGIYFEAVANTLVQNNRFYGLRKAGVLYEIAQYNQISGNNFDLCGQENDNDTGAIVVKNTSSIEVRELMISNNLFNRNNSNDISLRGSFSSGGHTGIINVMVHGNDSDHVKGRFLYIDSALHTVIANNRIHDSGQQSHNTFAAIEVTGNSDETQIFGNVNTIQASNPAAKYGLLTGGSTTNTVVGINSFAGVTGAVSLAGTMKASSMYGPLRLRGTAPSVGPNEIGLGAATTTTAGPAGTASPLPSLPAGYLTVNIGGTSYKIPYYNQ